MQRLLASFLAFPLVAACACESGIEIMGDTGIDVASPDASDPLLDTSVEAFEPPVDGLGELGWEESAIPWCPSTPETMNSLDVWSTPGNVYVLTGYSYYDAATMSGCQVAYIFRNDGTGWMQTFEETFRIPLGLDEMTGFPLGPLVALGSGGLESDCNLFVIDGEVRSCTFADCSGVQDVFVVSDGLAYALMEDRLIYYDGISWGPFPAAYTPYRVDDLWASETEVFCSGEAGTVLSLKDGSWLIHDTRTMGDLGAIWGFGGDDVWVVGGETGLIHWDGSEWTPVTWPDAPRFDVFNGIDGLWGSDDGVLFLHNDDYLIRRDSDGFTMLLNVRYEIGLTIAAIWGNSANEVFVALTDDDVATGCGTEFLLWWDGSEFHWF